MKQSNRFPFAIEMLQFHITKMRLTKMLKIIKHHSYRAGNTKLINVSTSCSLRSYVWENNKSNFYIFHRLTNWQTTKHEIISLLTFSIRKKFTRFHAPFCIRLSNMQSKIFDIRTVTLHSGETCSNWIFYIIRRMELRHFRCCRLLFIIHVWCFQYRVRNACGCGTNSYACIAYVILYYYLLMFVFFHVSIHLSVGFRPDFGRPNCTVCVCVFVCLSSTRIKIIIKYSMATRNHNV